VTWPKIVAFFQHPYAWNDRSRVACDLASQWADQVVVLQPSVEAGRIPEELEISRLLVPEMRFADPGWWRRAWLRLIEEQELTERDVVVPMRNLEVVHDYAVVRDLIRGAPGKVLKATRYTMFGTRHYRVDSVFRPQWRPFSIPVVADPTFVTSEFPDHAFDASRQLETSIVTLDYSGGYGVPDTKSMKPYDGIFFFDDDDLEPVH